MPNYPLLFVERLSEHDLQVLAGLDGAPATTTELRRLLSSEPETIESFLGDRRLFEHVFEDRGRAVIDVLTPSLAFAALVHETMRALGSSSYVPEWVGAGERLPVFDVVSLREFVDDRTRRYMIIELLVSFTRVASGSTWVRTSRGYRRRRFSELDPVSLAELVDSLPADRRAGGYRRLGDVALFLTGVFPDHTARHPPSALRRARLANSAGLTDRGNGFEYVRFLEAVGSRSYDRAADAAFLAPDSKDSLHDLADKFTEARRFLNFLADSYLHRLETGLMSPIG